MSAKHPDEIFMAQALELARARLGKVAPNPAVACLIVRHGKVVGAGATGEGGRPHAEEIALAEAGDAAEGATAYVSLEPCNARSTGSKSCAQRLLEAGVQRVVVPARIPIHRRRTASRGWAPAALKCASACCRRRLKR